MNNTVLKQLFMFMRTDSGRSSAGSAGWNEPHDLIWSLHPQALPLRGHPRPRSSARTRTTAHAMSATGQWSLGSTLSMWPAMKRTLSTAPSWPTLSLTATPVMQTRSVAAVETKPGRLERVLNGSNQFVLHVKHDFLNKHHWLGLQLPVFMLILNFVCKLYFFYILLSSRFGP